MSLDKVFLLGVWNSHITEEDRDLMVNAFTVVDKCLLLEKIVVLGVYNDEF